MITTVESTNDSGQVVTKTIDTAKIEREHRLLCHVGRVLAFLSPVLIPLLKNPITLFAGIVAYLPFALVKEINSRKSA